MLVETYECEETATETPELTDDAIRLIEQMGLKGQASLIKKPDEGDAVRCPYRRITTEESTVFGLLCESKTGLENYSSGPIPLRVLQVAAHVRSMELPELGYMEVWYPAEADRKDPVLVARQGQYSGHNYLLARWGEVLDEMPALRKKATEIYRENLKEAVNEIMTKCRSLLDGIDTRPLGKAKMPTFYE